MKDKMKKKNKNYLILIALILVITIGYALLTQELFIRGSSQLKDSKWDIHWDNVQVHPKSVKGESVTQAAQITNTEKTLVEYSITLSEPGEFYEFTVDAKNEGTIDGMVDVVSNKVYESNGTTEKELPSYLTYSVTYSGGKTISPKHLLKAGETETYKVRVEFKDVPANQLPTSEETLKFKFSVVYVQADDTAQPRITGMLMVHNDDATKTFGKDIARDSFESITTVDNLNIPDNAMDSWDVSEKQNETVIAWYTDNDNNGKYELYIGQDGGVIANPDSSYAFYQFENATSINLSDLDTSKVTDMQSMFYNCTSLTTLDVSNFDTSNVTDMSFLLRNCSVLKNIDSLRNWDTYNVTSMYGTIMGMKELESIDALRGWDTSKVTTMRSMFSGCINLTNIRAVSSWNTSNVTSMRHMFASCTYLQNIDATSNWNTSSVTDMMSMFNGCTNLNNISGTQNWDTSNLTNTSYMFAYCMNLNGTFTITGNPSTYISMFIGASSSPGVSTTINYSSVTTNIDKIIGTKSKDSKVIKGVQID